MILSKLSKLVVIGVGLIGGSFALALRRADLVNYVVGIGRSRENMRQALELGIIDEYSNDIVAALSGADLVLLAAPVKQTARIMQQIAPHLENYAVISDVGSTKLGVVEVARTYLDKHINRFIPAHPIAGTEFNGAKAAFAELFQNKPVVLTPLQENDQHAVDYVEALWQRCGAKISSMSPEQHDQMLAVISHLPHMLAFSLMQHIQTQSLSLSNGDPLEMLQLAGTSLEGMTRITASSPEMWRDICLENKAALLAQIEAYQQELSILQAMLSKSDGESLQKLFLEAHTLKKKWMVSRNKT